MSKLFLIVGGGAGAKIAEAFTHLCAAGLGPSEAHLLFVDGDTGNGNLGRAVNTVKDYIRLQHSWVRAAGHIPAFDAAANGSAGPTASTGRSLFGTTLFIYPVTDKIETIIPGASNLRDSLGQDHEFADVLDLLYDADEQATRCEDGFRARPNLGCLLMSRYLRVTLTVGPGAAFIEQLSGASADSAHTRVAVAGSIFGGTGASMFPVVRNAIENAVRKHRNVEKLDFGNFHWCSVMLLPYFRPTERRDSVDPSRSLLDASSTLQYYSTAGSPYSCVYLIGSDDPGRNRVRPVTGSRDQCNPSFFEEVIAALALLDFLYEPEGRRREPVRIFDLGSTRTVTWAALPWPAALRPNGVDGVAQLMHLASFLFKRGGAIRPQAYEWGLAGLLRQLDSRALSLESWFTKVLEKWAEAHPAVRNAKASDRPALIATGIAEQSIDDLMPACLRYFARLLWWAYASALQDGDRRDSLDLLAFDTSGDYVHILEHMASVGLGAPNGTAAVDFSDDNALARLLAAAHLAMVRSRQGHASAGSQLLNPTFQLWSDAQMGGSPGTVRLILRGSTGHVRQTLSDAGLSDLSDDYTRNQI